MSVLDINSRDYWVDTQTMQTPLMLATAVVLGMYNFCERVVQGTQNISLNALHNVANMYRIINEFVRAHTNRPARTFILGLVVGGVSALGGLAQAKDVLVGSLIGGFGNSLSTWVMPETATDDKVIELERMTKNQQIEIDNLKGQLKDVSDKFTQLQSMYLENNKTTQNIMCIIQALNDPIKKEN